MTDAFAGSLVTQVDSEQPVLRRIRLVVRSGPDAGHHHEMPMGTIIVGTHRDADLVLQDPRVSRRHCEVSVVDDGVRVVDLGSKNGVLHGGSRVDEVLLAPGAQIQLGETTLGVEAVDAPWDVGEGTGVFGRLTTRSPAMRRIFGLLERVAPSEATVLLQGETGVGKDVLARTLHEQSARRAGPLVVFDCAAVSPQLIAGELFGHKKGAFTGAERDRAGVFEAARSGTVFLDEIGELSLDLQPTLLRVLESRQVRRVGENTPRDVDVRVIAATNRDLRAEVQARRFREDLFYRLAIVKVSIPPLRERKEDIELLARRFLVDFGRSGDELSERDVDRLRRHHWPGNVRELRNALEQSAALSTGRFSLSADAGLAPLTREQTPVATLEHAPPDRARGASVAVAGRAAAKPLAGTGGPSGAGGGDDADLLRLPFKEARASAIERFERDYVRSLLEREGGNVSGAAREAAIDRNYLYRLMKKYGIEQEEFRR